MSNFPGIGRHSRTSEYKLPKLVTVVNLEPDRVPEFWSKLPFIDKPRRLSL